MPRGDGTGPAGMGRMSGRGMGFCAGFDAPGFMNPGFGRGFGRGRGMGRGFGRGFGGGFGRARMAPMPVEAPIERYEPVQITKEDEKSMLEAELREIEFETNEIKKRLKELK